MLSKMQFRKLLNNILMLPICQSTGVTIKDQSAKTGDFSVTLQFGAGHTNEWRLYSNGGKLVLQNMRSIGNRIILTYNPTTLTLDDASVALLRSRILPSQYTVGDIVATIVNTADGLEKNRSDVYNKVYMPISQCVDQLGELDMYVVVNRKQTVPFREMMSDDMLSAPVSSVKHMVIDVFGKNPKLKHAIPFFHIILSDGIMALYRYMFVGGKLLLGTIADRFNLSITETVDKYDDKQNTLNDLIRNAIEKWAINPYDADSNGNPPKESIKRSSRCALGFVAALQKNSMGIEYKPAYLITPPSVGFIPGYGLDDFYTCYPVKKSTIHIYIQASAKRDICFTYASPLYGEIVRLHVDVDKSSIRNKNNLSDKRNIFIVSSLTKPIIEYNDGMKNIHTLQSFDSAGAIEKAIKIVRSLVAIAAFMSDVVKIVDYCTTASRRSERNIMDTINPVISITINASEKIAPHGVIKISSNTNPETIDLDCMVNTSDNPPVLLYKTKNAIKFYPFNNTSNNTLFAQCINYIMTGQDRTLGAVLTKTIANLFSVNLYVNGKGHIVNTQSNQQNKVYNAFQFQSNSQLGNKLLDIRDALINTFGRGIIGTPDAPSLFDPSHMNTSKFNYSVNKVKQDGNTVPVLAEFGVYGNHGIYGAGGSFYAMPVNNEIKVYCNFSGKAKEVTVVSDGDTGKLVLSDAFLKWYLLDCSTNQVTRALLQAIDDNNDVRYKTVRKDWNPELQKIEVHKKLVYKLNGRVKNILTGTENDDNAPNEIIEYEDRETMGLDPNVDVDKLMNSYKTPVYSGNNNAADEFNQMFVPNDSYHAATDAENIPSDTDLLLHEVPDSEKTKFYSPHFSPNK